MATFKDKYDAISLETVIKTLDKKKVVTSLSLTVHENSFKTFSYK